MFQVSTWILNSSRISEMGISKYFSNSAQFHGFDIRLALRIIVGNETRNLNMFLAA